MIFKQETIQSWFSGVGSSINSEVIQPFQNAEQVIWKYNQAIQHNSLTQQGWERLLAQSDDSLKAYLTSIKGTAATMNGYNVSLQGNIIGFKKVSSAITQYNALSASGAKEQNIFANAVSVTNGKLGTYLTGLNGAKASIGGYVVSLVGATVKTVALKVATIALNSAITMGASLIISGIVSAISEWIHKTENMISASEDAIGKIKSINDELKNNQKTISDTAKRYAELAQGVNQLTGENISLSNEDYEEFLTLSNQLAEMFPTLTRNYNDNGDAIVQLSGDVDTIVGSLQNLIEAQRDLANRQIVDELPTVFDGVAAKSDKYEQQLSDLESRRDALVKSLGDVQSEEFSSNFMDGFSNKWIEISGDNLEVISQMRDDYMKILKEANIDFEELTPTYEVKDGIEVPVGFTIKINSSDEDVAKAKNTIDSKIQELASRYETDINKLNEEINITNEKNKANWTSLSSSIFAWLSTDDSFKVMDDTMQATVQNIVNSLDWEKLNFSSWEDAKQYIQDNILSLFNTPEGKETLADIEVMFGIQTQFNNGDITVEQYQQKLQNFLNSIENLPPETKKSILLLFGIQTNDDGTTTSDVDTMVENVKKKLKGTEFDDKVGELSLGDLKIAADLEVGDDTIQSWDELIERIEKVKSEGNETDILSFSEAWNSEDFENARKELLSLAEAGQLTPETLESTEKYKTLLEQTGLSAEEAAKKINSMTDASTQLQSMSTQISKMSDMLADKKNGTTASASDLAGFDATVKGLESWDEFERVMMSSKSSMKQCQQAANALATEWVNGSNFLANLTEENKQAYITQLDLMGVENANEVVTAALAQKKRELAAQTEYETLATEYNSDAKNRNNQITTDLTNATIGEIAEIIAEGNATADTTQVMAEFALSKIDVNNAQIDTSSDIEQIVAIANAAGASAEYVDTLRTALNNLQKAEQGKKQELPLAGIGAQVANTSAEINVAAARDDVESALNDIKNQIKENRIDPSDYIIKPSGSSSYKPSGGSGGSRGGSKTKETKQTIDWIERKITILNNKIDTFATKASDAWSSWTSRTKALNSEMETTKKLLTSVYGVSSKTQKKLNSQRDSAKNKLDKYVKKNSKVLTSSTIKKINSGKLDASKLSKKDKKVVEKYKKLQKDYEKKAKKASQNPAADYYFSKANSVAKKYKLSPAIIKKIKNGTINISDYNESMANAIQKYQDYYDKGKDAQKSKKETKQKLNELAQQNFELIQSKWDARIGYQENRKNAVSDALNLAQSKGELIGSSYYTKQKDINNKEINKYKKEEAELKKAMKGVKKYSEEWYNMKSKISEVHSKYVQLQADNAELQRSINELKFDRFDELINKFGDITDEANFLIDMLDSDNLFNSDNGSITNDGITAMGLTAQNYDVYLAQAEEYKKSIADLDRMYKNGEIGISDYNSRMRELQGGYRDSIKSANDAKKAVIDYVKQGLDAQNEALSKSIEKQKELLESERDLKEFQDKITNQNKNIANLRKQIAALEGDDSESNRKRLQQLKSDLQDAEKEQADTLYERSVSDQEKALDDMLTKSQDAAESYLKDSEKVFIDALSYVNANTSQVSQNLEKISKDLGYDISTYITNAWKDGGDAVGTYESTLSSNVPKITAQIQLITNAWKAQCEAADKAAKASAKAAAGTDETTKDTDKKGNSSNGSGNKSKTSSAKDIKRYITDHADKAKQKKSYYGVLNQYIYGKTGGKVLSVKEEVELAKMLGVSVKKDLSGTSDRQKILDALKKKKIAFANGGVLGDLVKVSGEDGLFIGSAGESILTKEQTQALINFRPVIPQLNTMVDLMKNVPISSASQSPTYQIDNRTIVEGVATDKIVKEMEGVAQRQAENVVRKINSATYAKGVRR